MDKSIFYYKNLLTRYIQHVTDIEGVSYLTDNFRTDHGNNYFSDDEWKELQEFIPDNDLHKKEEKNDAS